MQEKLPSLKFVLYVLLDSWQLLVPGWRILRHKTFRKKRRHSFHGILKLFPRKLRKLYKTDSQQGNIWTTGINAEEINFGADAISQPRCDKPAST